MLRFGCNATKQEARFITAKQTRSIDYCSRECLSGRGNCPGGSCPGVDMVGIPSDVTMTSSGRGTWFVVIRSRRTPMRSVSARRRWQCSRSGQASYDRNELNGAISRRRIATGGMRCRPSACPPYRPPAKSLK